MTKFKILKSTPYKNTTLSSVVIHALRTGKGITWLDNVRIPYIDEKNVPNKSISGDSVGLGEIIAGHQFYPSNKGRFPANLLCSDDVLNDGIERKTGDLTGQIDGKNRQVYGKYKGISYYYKGDSGSYSRYFDLDKWWGNLLERIENEA